MSGYSLDGTLFSSGVFYIKSRGRRIFIAGVLIVNQPKTANFADTP